MHSRDLFADLRIRCPLLVFMWWNAAKGGGEETIYILFWPICLKGIISIFRHMGASISLSEPRAIILNVLKNDGPDDTINRFYCVSLCQNWFEFAALV